ncbi:MAG: fibrobacter succinogenes major paralogous domain-containing protein, partial [Saprospiraceae bacterium]|nr:fibrobacter succinogenes major paralogous domain-containing protein [Saprospiraceae bacterium]
NNDVSNNAIYGKLYNWYTTKGDTLCPTGWHVPTDAEWTTLTNYLGGEGVAGGKMKATGTAYWNDPNTGAINSSGFSVRPGGYRNFDGSFTSIRNGALFWSATERGNFDAWERGLFNNNGVVGRFNSNKSVGASVRCLRD